MKIYTFQPKSLINEIEQSGAVFVDFKKTNLYKHITEGNPFVFDAYQWMATKLAEKTGIWIRELWGDKVNYPKDKDGDYIDEKGKKVPPLPFWGWYLTDGKNDPPDPLNYAFDGGENRSFIDWNKNEDQTILLTLEIPENLVLLSDGNAWYCALEGRPCYEYEDEITEQLKYEEYFRKINHIASIQDVKSKKEAYHSIWEETVNTWDNILRLEGRRLHTFMGMPERKDIQAVFPIIRKEWIL